MSEQQAGHLDEPVDGEPEDEGRPTSEERRAWRVAALRLVRQYPDPALRNAATAVAEVDDEVQRLAERMLDVMERAHGVGLAAPQLGILRRILVYRATDEDVPKVLINPELVERSDETEVGTEGCLSLLGGELQVPVARHLRVRVSGRDASGDAVDMDVEGFEARVIQHEIDHLDGILIFDRAEDQERREALRELRLRAG
ncbi:MAG TPA: peptide deformylase [Gaiellales bacterium]|jgi:peptide deformylase|nr:peptide deformylase [Gaiellales bacterium]